MTQHGITKKEARAQKAVGTLKKYQVVFSAKAEVIVTGRATIEAISEADAQAKAIAIDHSGHFGSAEILDWDIESGPVVNTSSIAFDWVESELP